jgi:glucose-6-phosphate 1-dehydrogenase
LSEKVWKVFNEDQIYRIDHYLGKETVQNILVLRFANIFFEPVWNRNFIENVQISVAESIGIGHRAGYYEEAGVLRDMFQNHLFQLLCIRAMEAPASFMADRVRDEKSKVLRAVRAFPLDRLDEFAVRGQYDRGDVDGTLQRSYLEEPGVRVGSTTETFAALKVFVDNWRWQGVPFYLRSGKRLPTRLTEIVIQFKPIPHLMFHPLQPRDLSPNRLILRIQPEEGLSLFFETKHPGPKLCLSSAAMDFSYEHSFGEPPEAYERLFLDAMAGDQTLFTRSDWVELSWALLDPLVARWASAGPPRLYPSGSWGPSEADRLLAAQGHQWSTGG